MSNSIPTGYEYHVIAPSAHPGLTCRFLKPTDFKIAELPPETIDFSKSTAFMPLAVALTPIGPMVFSLAARPAYEDGTVEQWLDYLLREEGYQHEAIMETRLGSLPAVTCDALQKADDVVMRMRFVLLEDGGRIFEISAMAPEAFWSNAVEKFTPMLSSFEIREVGGSKVPLSAHSSASAAATKAQSGQTAEPAPAPNSTGGGNNSARLTNEELAALALAENASSLDPEQPMNVNLRNNGVGLVPRLVSVDLPSKSAKIGTGAVEGIFRVPLGWHAIDDGKRALVFDPGGSIQVNLSQRLHEGLSSSDFARGCLKEYLDQQPDLQVAELQLDGIAGAGVRGAKIESETLDQYFLVRDLGRTGLYLVARVTASEEDATRALNLAGDILATFEAPDAPAR